MKKWREDNPEKYKAYRLSRRAENIISLSKRYAKEANIAPISVTASELREWLSAQPQKCMICRRENIELVIDHDHHTGTLRGMLCRFCNRLVGIIEKHDKLLSAAKDYLQATAKII